MSADTFLFWLLATVTLLSGLGVILVGNPIYSALCLAMTMVGISALFASLGAYFIAGKPRLLEPGMVITVEPGIYIAHNAAVAEEYRGIGVRIEDDVLVTDGRALVLSDAIPKRVDEIERVCSRAA